VRTTTPTRLVICAKSRWAATPRREHLLAMQAIANGIDVTFIEQADDVRALRSRDRRGYLRSLFAGSRPAVVPTSSGRLSVIRRATVAPGHRGGIALANDTRLLSRDLARYDDPNVIVVATTPWFWPAVSQLRFARKTVDFGDDWSTLIPARAPLIKDLHARIAREADAIVVASASLADEFSDREVHVVRNGTDTALVEAAVTPPPGRRRMVYVGTLSERFDAHLMQRVLEQLPEWSLELYGPCFYARSGARPDAELAGLLASGDGRVTWYGKVARAELATVIDRGDVLLIPNRAEMSRGQDSMKLYDYLARSRPVVLTSSASREPLPGVAVADDAAAFAAAVRAIEGSSVDTQRAQRAWALNNTYSGRWPSWWAAINGHTMASEVVG
jgi:glycosyltransferase involved in cell wall biosynthesis